MTMLETSRYAIPYPDENERWALGNEQIAGIAQILDPVSGAPLLTPFSMGPAASRPVSTVEAPSGKPGRSYLSVDTGAFEIDTGTGWVRINIGDSLTLAGTLTVAGLSTLTGGAIAPARLNAQTGTAYSLVADDASKTLTLTNSAAIAVTIPPNATVAFPVGTMIDVVQGGDGQVTFAGGAGVTINSYQGKLRIAGKYAAVTLIKTATNTWLLVGNLA